MERTVWKRLLLRRQSDRSVLCRRSHRWHLCSVCTSGGNVGCLGTFVNPCQKVTAHFSANLFWANIVKMTRGTATPTPPTSSTTTKPTTSPTTTKGPVSSSTKSTTTTTSSPPASGSGMAGKPMYVLCLLTYCSRLYSLLYVKHPVRRQHLLTFLLLALCIIW